MKKNEFISQEVKLPPNKFLFTIFQYSFSRVCHCVLIVIDQLKIISKLSGQMLIESYFFYFSVYIYISTTKIKS